MATGLQQAEEAFAGMLSGQPDKQQQLEASTEDAEPEAEEPEVEASPEVEESEETEEAVTEEPEEAYYPIKLDGVDHEVTLGEALAGYQRQSDYTKKTQALADEKKQVQSEVEAAKQQRLQYEQSLERLAQIQQSQLPQEPDWDTLMESDPLEWMKQKELFRTQKEKAQELQAEHYRMQQVKQAEQEEQMQVYLQDQHQALMSAIPEWSDPKVMHQEKNDIKNYAISIGYSADEISQVYDSRAVLALRSAMIASGLSGKGAKKLKPAQSAIRAVSPGSAPEKPRKQTSVHKAKIRLAKTGKMSDAAEVFKQLL
jgi:hypothetical protein